MCCFIFELPSMKCDLVCLCVYYVYIYIYVCRIGSVAPHSSGAITTCSCTTRRPMSTAMILVSTRCNTRQHAARHCNTLQHSATRCNTLQHAATRCNTLRDTATHCNTLQHTALRGHQCEGR